MRAVSEGYLAEDLNLSNAFACVLFHQIMFPASIGAVKHNGCVMMSIQIYCPSFL